MTLWLAFAGVLLAAILSLVLSTLNYSVRDFSRAKLQENLSRINRSKWFDRTIELQPDLAFVTAIGRLLANILVLIGILHLVSHWIDSEWLRYLAAVILSGVLTLVVSVAIPHALAEHAGERIMANQISFLHALRIALLPATKVMHAVDRTIGDMFITDEISEAEQNGQAIQQEILSVVEEGEKEGVVDEQEREMIESVIQFRDTHVGQVMTARTDVIGLSITASLADVRRVVEESGHSRIPVFRDSLDQIVGVLYARDLLKHLGAPPEEFEIRSAMRQPFYVHETKPLRDLLQDFRIQKVHMAIVLDEYGGTAGLVTIEDVLEELVGDISDEHEPREPSMIKRVSDNAFEVDARVRLEELNRNLSTSLPEDAGYETLGGFISNTLGRIPQMGTRFEHPGVLVTVMDAEPQRVTRVRIELIPRPADEQAAANP